MSRSTITTRSRAPLTELALSTFLTSFTLPSPVSLPAKRTTGSPSSSMQSPASTSQPSGASSSKQTMYSSEKNKRKAAAADLDNEDGLNTVKRGTRFFEVTPKAKSILDRDDLGTGRSPARRLFVEGSEKRSFGISGAVPAPDSIIQSQRSLAPSPPITRASTPTINGNNIPFVADMTITFDPNVDLHDPGFEIYLDTTIPRSNFPLAFDAEAFDPSSPASSSRSFVYNEDQENIPPALSTTSTPSKAFKGSRSTLASPSSSRYSQFDLDDEYLLATGSPGSGRLRSRALERSKLGLGNIVGEYDDEDDELDTQTLTPGSVTKRDLRGKAKLFREVDRI